MHIQGVGSFIIAMEPWKSALYPQEIRVSYRLKFDELFDGPLQTEEAMEVLRGLTKAVAAESMLMDENDSMSVLMLGERLTEPVRDYERLVQSRAGKISKWLKEHAERVHEAKRLERFAIEFRPDQHCASVLWRPDGTAVQCIVIRKEIRANQFLTFHAYACAGGSNSPERSVQHLTDLHNYPFLSLKEAQSKVSALEREAKERGWVTIAHLRNTF